MKTRVISGLIMAPLLIVVYLGGYFLLAGVFALSWLALREFSAAFGERKPATWVFAASLAILYGGYLIPPLRALIMLPWVFVSVALGLISMFAVTKRGLTAGLGSIVGVFLCIFFTFHIVLTDNYYSAHSAPNGGLGFSGLDNYVWIIVLTAFGTDIFAYFVGSLLGQHKLCPELSPKKTVEGAVGGVLGSVVLCGLFCFLLSLLRKSGFVTTSFVQFDDCIALGVLGGIVAQLGDLAASALKRHLSVKDFGTLIPGHGGVLDRIDSVLFTAPLVFYYMMLKAAFLAQ